MLSLKRQALANFKSITCNQPFTDPPSFTWSFTERLIQDCSKVPIEKIVCLFPTSNLVERAHWTDKGSERPDWTGTSQLVAVSGEVKNYETSPFSESVCCKFCIPSLYLRFFCFHPPRMNTPPVSKRIASQILPVQKLVQPMLFTQRRQFKWTRL